jgi:predicted 3-demethylubiquinone-9 3-methyltransferase (glyoxalase superfamily)
MSQKITPFLWFDGRAEEAMNFYTSIFKDSEVLSVARYPDAMPDMAGKVMTANFRINGLEFIALNAGPDFKFTEAVSFMIDCKGQDEVDYYWNSLIAGGGEPSQCGWLKDKFGLSWQVTPRELMELMGDKDPAKASRVMQAMLQMSKIEIAKLQEAYDHEPVAAGD